MKFELRPPRKKYSDSELLDDMKRVAHLLHKSTLDQKEYKQHGRYTPDIFADRFGSWFAALSRAGLEPKRRMPATEDELLKDLHRVFEKLGQATITLKDYSRLGNYSVGPFLRVFGTWTTAVKKVGIALSDNCHPPIPDKQLFQNLERVWIALGRQPTYNDMKGPRSEHSITTYERRFGSWRAACEAFVTYANELMPGSPEEIFSTQATVAPAIKEPQGSLPRKKEQRTPRTPNERLRFVVMRRDNFACRSCGRSPALQPGVVLHIDHIVPWASGGETLLQNLQTLCERCNLGKGRLDG